MTHPDRLVHVDAAAMADLIRTSALPVLVDFYADWCGPCKMMTPVLERFAQEHAGAVIVAKLDTDANPEPAWQHQVQGIPTMILFVNGKEAARQVGAVPAPYLERMLSKVAA